jgi:DNA-binding transcriptional regulator YdaS (Cro superfamily)
MGAAADFIPDGVRRRLSVAAGELVAVLGGVRDVARLAGVSEAAVSNWGNVNRPEIMPAGIAAALEMRLGVPVFTRAMAEFTGHACRPADDEAGAGGDMTGHLVRVAGAAGEAISLIAGSLADGRVTPCEARDVLAGLGAAQGAFSEAGRAIAAHLTPDGARKDGA